MRSPEIATITSGRYRSVHSFGLRPPGEPDALREAEPLSWTAPDGLEIQGWLLKPASKGPHPLVMEVHGGPVRHWRTRWLGRNALHTLLLLEHGCAVFFPNPRGSGGRGVEFARRVRGDINGADTFDYLSGLDHLVAREIVDERRIGVTGGSYGGNMTCWLISQDARFAAAVALAPVTNQVTERLIGNIPQFQDLFLEDNYTNPGGAWFDHYLGTGQAAE